MLLLAKLLEGNRQKLVLLVIWKCLMDYMYGAIITDVFAYMNNIAHYNYYKLFISWILFFVFFLISGLLSEGMLKFSYTFLFMFSLVPSLTVWWVRDDNNQCMILILLYWMCWGGFSIIVERTRFLGTKFLLSRRLYSETLSTKVKNKKKKNNIGFIISAFMACLVLVLLFSYKYGGGRLFISLGSVYKYRQVTGAAMSSLESYVFNWLPTVFMPFVLMYFLIHKHIVGTIVISLLISMCYSIYGNKAMLFMLPLTVGITIIHKVNLKKYLINYILFGMNFLTLLSCIVYHAGITRWGVALVDRISTGISTGHFYYYDFFQKHEFLYLRQSIFRLFVKSPYNQAIGVIIGSHPDYNSTGNANNFNNGVFSDAYANFGVVGVILFPLLFVLSIRFFEMILMEIDESYKYLILCWLLLYCMSIGYFQWLLSGGFIASIIFMQLYRKSRIKLF